jgi:hypothetical protein
MVMGDAAAKGDQSVDLGRGARRQGGVVLENSPLVWEEMGICRTTGGPVRRARQGVGGNGRPTGRIRLEGFPDVALVWPCQIGWVGRCFVDGEGR